MTVTRAQLKQRIEMRLIDYQEAGNASAIGDGASLQFRLPDRFIVDQDNGGGVGLQIHHTNDDGSEDAILLNGSTAALHTATEGSDFTVDYGTSWVTLKAGGPLDLAGANVPGKNQNDELIFSYEYKHYPGELIDDLVNQAINELYYNYYVEDVDETCSVGADQRIVPPVDADMITKLELASGTGRWLWFPDWRTEGADKVTAIVLKRYLSPGQSVRVSYIRRGSPFFPAPGDSTPGDTEDDFATTVGYPERAVEAIVRWVVAETIDQGMIQRARTDTAMLAEGVNAVFMRDLIAAAQQWRYKADLYTQRTKMNPPVLHNA